MNTPSFLRRLALPLLTLILGWQLGSAVTQNSWQQQWNEFSSRFGLSEEGTIGDPEQQVDLTLFWTVWRTAMQNYVEPSEIDNREMYYGAITGLVEGIGDPYSTFFTPKENEEFRDALGGRLEGIGAEMTERDGLIVVVSPLNGSPAKEAGLQPEDIVIAVDGEPIDTLNFLEVIAKIRGPKGTDVTLTIVRPDANEQLELTITRDAITVPSVELTFEESDEGNVAIIAVNQFGALTTREMRNAIEQIAERDDVAGAIVDLRYNGGGYLEGAVEMASFFVEGTPTIVTVERRNGNDVKHNASGRPLAPELPLIILINQGTASASEIVAGSLQDLDRATVIGTQSFGKGTVQELFEFPDGSSIRLTVAHWLTTNGRNLAKEGVTPDIEMEDDPETTDIDEQLERALRELMAN